MVNSYVWELLSSHLIHPVDLYYNLGEEDKRHKVTLWGTSAFTAGK